MPPRRPTVMGERLDDLVPALRAVRDNITETDDGMWSVDCNLSPEKMVPLCRALMRVEARLLREDANRLSAEMQPWRTPEQRRADALLELAKMLPRARRPTRQAPAPGR